MNIYRCRVGVLVLYIKRKKWSARPKSDQILLKFRDERSGVVIEMLEGNSLVLQDEDTGKILG